MQSLILHAVYPFVQIGRQSTKTTGVRFTLIIITINRIKHASLIVSCIIRCEHNHSQQWIYNHKVPIQQSTTHNFTNTYSCQVYKQTRLFLEHAMCLDNSNMCGTNSFISEAVASDAYKHIITTRIMNTEVFNNNNWR